MKRLVALACVAIGLSWMASPVQAQLTWQELETMIRQQRRPTPATVKATIVQPTLPQATLILTAPSPSPSPIKLPIPQKPLPPAPAE